MKVLVPLLVVLATTEADKFLGKFKNHTNIVHHQDTDNHYGHHHKIDLENLARKLATIIYRRIQKNNNVHPIVYQQVQTSSTQPTHTYTAQPVQTLPAEPFQTIQTIATEPVETYDAEPVQSYDAEPVHSYDAEQVKPKITSYRRHRTVQMSVKSYHH